MTQPVHIETRTAPPHRVWWALIQLQSLFSVGTGVPGTLTKDGCARVDPYDAGYWQDRAELAGHADRSSMVVADYLRGRPSTLTAVDRGRALPDHAAGPVVGAGVRPPRVVPDGAQSRSPAQFVLAFPALHKPGQPAFRRHARWQLDAGRVL